MIRRSRHAADTFFASLNEAVLATIAKGYGQKMVKYNNIEELKDIVNLLKII